MATSPIYNWPEPDNTDLVKNGALAIRTLGDAIDTTMGTMVAKTIVDAKGDLIAGTAADTAARLAVGANGETLVADSSTSTGLDWKSATEQYPWQTWSPSYDNITVGNGTAVARYQQIGKTVNVRYQLTFGSTTTIAYLPGLSLPVTAAATAYNQTNLHLSDSGANGYFGSAYFSNTSYVYFFVSQANSTYSFMQGVSATIPFTWTTSDAIYLTMTYEAA